MFSFPTVCLAAFSSLLLRNAVKLGYLGVSLDCLFSSSVLQNDHVTPVP